MKLFVADTGPLIHLQQIGALDLLPKIGEIWTTPMVLEELRRHVPEFQTASIPNWLHLAEPSTSARSQAAHWIQAGLLDAGEAEALAYASETHSDAFLSDDGSAREMARIYGLESRGTLGIILLASVQGILDRDGASTLLGKLSSHSTLWMSSRVKQSAFEAMGKIFGQDNVS